MRSSSKSLKSLFFCRSDLSWRKNAKSNGARSSEYRACCILPYLFSSSTPVSSSTNILYHLYSYLCCTCNPLNMTLNVSMGIIFADKQNSMTLRMSFDGVTSVIFPISYHDLCAISDISNNKQPTKEYQTSKERRHELVMILFDVCKSWTPICLFFCLPNRKVGILSFYFFSKCSVVRYLRCYSDCRNDVIV